VARSVHDAADGTIRGIPSEIAASPVAALPMTTSASKPTDVAWMLEQLWAPIVAVTAVHGGRENGLISSTVVTASLLPESPRVVVQLSKTNLTHDLVCASGALAVHFLPDDDRGLELFRTLGIRTGRETSKLDAVATAPGLTGSPILQDAVAYVEARVAETHDVEGSTIVVADVVGGARIRNTALLTIDAVRERLPPEWADEWERRLEAELAAARRHR
jgi:flavin reductase (DIM6/NTAB) family NADH-FMN oxidoreductase RutF